MKLKFTKAKNKYTGKREWRVKCFKNKTDKTPTFSGHYHSFFKAVGGAAKAWKYTFKYPTTVSKTFWQVLFGKLGF